MIMLYIFRKKNQILGRIRDIRPKYLLTHSGIKNMLTKVPKLYVHLFLNNE